MCEETVNTTIVLLQSMSTVFTALFVISVLVLGVCGAAGGRDNLEKKLKKTNAAIAETAEDVKRLNKEVKEQRKKCHSKLKVSGGLQEKGDAEHKKLVKTIEELYKKLLKSYDAEVALADISKDKEKLELSIAFTLENIQKYEKRREKGMDKKCFDLEKTTTKHKVIRSEFIVPRKIDDTIVLKNQLRLAESKLEQEIDHKEEKKLQLKLEIDWCKAQQKHIDKTMKTITKNKAEAKKAIDKLNKELAMQKEKKVKDAVNVKRLVETKKKAKKVLEKYKKFALAKECYSKLYKDIVASVYNNS